MDSFAKTIQLDDESHRSLLKMIGVKPWRILSPCIQLADMHVTSPSLSIECGPRAYSAITCTWFESPHTFTDYWRISIAETTKPLGIEMNSDGALVAPCAINLYNALPISSIEVYSSCWEWSDNDAAERVEWDSALLFDMQQDRRFCIWCQLDGPGIATEVSYTEKQELIEDVLKNASLRTRIG